MSQENETPEDAAEKSAFAGDTAPHVDDDDTPGVSEDALDTEELGEGGPAGA
jgi:hypothetical protein